MPTPNPTRRRVLALGLTGALAGAISPAAALAPRASADRGDSGRPGSGRGPGHRHLDRALAALEQRSGRTIGVAAGYGHQGWYGYRGSTRFPMCSLFKPLVVGVLLRAHAYDDTYWQRPIRFSASHVVVNSPVCAADPDREMTVSELADAALRYSDNTAGNLLLGLAGGPRAVTDLAADLGATRTRLDRWEPDLNAAVPGDRRDTSSPADIVRLYRALLLGNAASRLGQARLRDWMLRNTTSGQRLRRFLPDGAELADKTGAGDYGVVNDAGTFWKGDDVLTVAVMTRTDTPGAANDNTVVAQVGKLLVEEFLS